MTLARGGRKHAGLVTYSRGRVHVTCSCGSVIGYVDPDEGGHADVLAALTVHRVEAKSRELKARTDARSGRRQSA